MKARIYLGINHFVNSKSPVVAGQEVDANFSGDGELTGSIDAIKYRTGYKENYRDNAFYRVALELENIPDYYLFSETKEITGIPEAFMTSTTLDKRNLSSFSATVYISVTSKSEPESVIILALQTNRSFCFSAS